MPEKQTETLEKPDSPTEPSEGAGLDEMRGRGKHNVFMETSDFENAILDAPAENKQEVREAANAEEEKVGDEGDAPATEEPAGDGATPTDEPVVDVAIDELQKKLFSSDADRAQLRQNVAETKKRVADLAPLIELGHAISQDPELLAAVRNRLAGGTKTQQKAAGAPIASAQFQNQLRSMMREEIGSAIGIHVEANRKLNTYDARAKKELPNFDLISQHPDFLTHLTLWNDLVQKGMKGEEGGATVPAEHTADPEFYAMKQAYTTMLQSNPDYQKAAGKALTKTAQANLEKKALAASIGSGSKTANVGERKLTQDEDDRVGMIKAFRGIGRSRRIPGAR